MFCANWLQEQRTEAWLIHHCSCSHSVFLLHPVTDFHNTCGNIMSLKLPCFCSIGFNWLVERCAPASISTSPPTHAHTQTHLNICLHMLLCMCILKQVFTEWIYRIMHDFFFYLKTQKILPELSTGWGTISQFTRAVIDSISGEYLSFSTVDLFPRICRTFPFNKFKVSPGIAEMPFDWL